MQQYRLWILTSYCHFVIIKPTIWQSYSFIYLHLIRDIRWSYIHLFRFFAPFYNFISQQIIEMQRLTPWGGLVSAWNKFMHLWCIHVCRCMHIFFPQVSVSYQHLGSSLIGSRGRLWGRTGKTATWMHGDPLHWDPLPLIQAHQPVSKIPPNILHYI